MENTLEIKKRRKDGDYWRGYFGRHWVLYAMLLLPVIFIFIFSYIPMVNVWLAFTPNNTIAPVLSLPFIGLENFERAFRMQPFQDAIRNTLMFSALDLLIGFPMPIILAILINEIKFERFKKITQSLSYIPNFISWIIIGGLATTMLSTNHGTINGIIYSIFGTTIPFLESPAHWVFTNVFLAIWRGVGWSSIIYLAAITNINPEYYEAAEIDGATRLRKIWHITLPGIRPTIIILLTLTMGGAMHADLARFMALQNALVHRVSEVIPHFVYIWGIRSSQFSLATAVGLFQSIINLFLLLTTNWVVRKLGGQGFW